MDRDHASQPLVPARCPPVPPLAMPAAWPGGLAAECGEPLVPLSPFAPRRLAVDPRYHAAGLPGALPECYAREGVARRLLVAAEALPPGWRLVVYDAWRPLAVQRALYTARLRALRAAHPGAPAAWLAREAARYVAPPSADPARPAPHATGRAVDLGVLDARGASLPMGTAFDTFAPRSHTRYYEQRLERGQRLAPAERAYLQHRRLLYAALTAAGFWNYPEEWWHFEYGAAQYGPLLGLGDAGAAG